MYFAGLRVNSVSQVRLKQLQELLETRTLRGYQTKVQKVRTIVYPKSAIPILTDVLEKHKEKVFGKHLLLFPLPWPSVGGKERKNGEKFVKIINKLLEPFAKNKALNLTSHSYRVNYVTQGIKHKSVEAAQ